MLSNLIFICDTNFIQGKHKFRKAGILYNWVKYMKNIRTFIFDQCCDYPRLSSLSFLPGNSSNTYFSWSLSQNNKILQSLKVSNMLSFQDGLGNDTLIISKEFLKRAGDKCRIFIFISWMNLARIQYCVNFLFFILYLFW